MTSVSLKSLYSTAFFTNKNGVGRPRGYREKVKFYLLHPDHLNTAYEGFSEIT